MRENLDLMKHEGLKRFFDIVAQVANSNFKSVAKKDLGITATSYFTGDKSDLISGYENQVLISAVEEKTGYETGFIFKIEDITSLTDMMMMGDGTPSPSLTDENKDAITEMINQLLGGIAVPLELELSEKFSFRVISVTELKDVTGFQASDYSVIEFSGKLRNSDLNFRFFCDSSFTSALHTEPNVMSTSDFFGANPPVNDEGHQSKGGAPSPNMEMLLDIDIPVSVRMGTAKLFLKDILGLGPGNIVELDQNADEPIELMVNDKLVARGEVVIVDGYFGFRIKEIISKAERIRKLKD